MYKTFYISIIYQIFLIQVDILITCLVQYFSEFLIRLSLCLFSFLGVMKDSVRSDIEKFGFYQMVTMIFICVPLILAGMFTLSYIFTASEVKYRYDSVFLLII